MPLFEYRCQSCDEIFESLILRQSDRTELVCPSCGSGQVAQVLSAFSSRGANQGGPSGGSGGCAPGAPS